MYKKRLFEAGDATAIFTKMLHICYIGWWLGFGQNSGKGRESGEQSVWVQTISNPQVAGSNPAGRAILRKMLRMVNQKFKPPLFGGGSFIMYVVWCGWSRP